MFQIHQWPNVIVHFDGDAFFVSVIQAINPTLKNKPVVTGRERGIATAMSYEAKRYGIKRGMRLFEIKKLCPQCVIVDSDYSLYETFSQKMFNIIKSFSPAVEEYSIDEGFADIQGLQRPLNKNYFEIGRAIKDKVESSLGISVSIGISLTKSLAKLASNSHKPSDLTVINGKMIEGFLRSIDVSAIWGIGPNTTAYLHKLGIRTALSFALKTEEFIKKYLNKPHYEIWQELRGKKIYEIIPGDKTTYQSISDTETFKPSTNNTNLLWSKLLTHIESAFKKAREFNYHVGRVMIFLKTQDFVYHACELKLIEKTAFPYLIREELKKGFKSIYKKDTLYRSTGCRLSDLKEKSTTQLGLFSVSTLREEKIKKIYPMIENKKIDFGTALYDQKKEKIQEEKKLKIPLLSI